MEMWFSEYHTKDVRHSLRVTRHLYAKKSDYQQIDIFDTPEFGRVLALDGNVMLTERDEYIYDEMITHVPMAVHPGIPILAPGEKITAEILDYIEFAKEKGCSMTGPEDPDIMRLNVLK